MSDATADWLSVHVQTTFPIYSEDFDPLISDLAVSVIGDLDRQGLHHAWFVVRYASDGYPHLRLRIKRTPGLTQQFVEERLTYHGERLNERNPGLVVAQHWIPYEPEVERYGGPYALPHCETFFCESSRMAARVLPTLSGRTRSVRLGRGALLTLGLVAKFHDTPEAVARWLAEYSHTMRFGAVALTAQPTQVSRSQLREALRRFWNGETMSPSVDDYVEASNTMKSTCVRLISEGKLGRTQFGEYDLWSLLAGQVHMTFNRLGISREEECMATAHLSEALSEDANVG